eukprot:jgi/Galph1/5556/GphlegSOOS_G4165.1
MTRFSNLHSIPVLSTALYSSSPSAVRHWYSRFSTVQQEKPQQQDNHSQSTEKLLFRHKEVMLYRFANLIPWAQFGFAIYAGYLFFGPHYIHGMASKDETIATSLLVYLLFIALCAGFIVATRLLTKGRVIEIRALPKNRKLRLYQYPYFGIGNAHFVEVKAGNIRVGNVEKLLRMGALVNKESPGFLHLLWKQPLGTFPIQVVTGNGKVVTFVMPISEYDFLQANQLANWLVSGDILSLHQEHSRT